MIMSCLDCESQERILNKWINQKDISIEEKQEREQFEYLFNDSNVVIFRLINCNNIIYLPQKLKIKKNFEIENCDNLQKISSCTINGNFSITNCNSLTYLPRKKMDVTGNFSIINCPRLTRLPINLTVNGIITINRCNTLTLLPTVNMKNCCIPLPVSIVITNCNNFIIFPSTLKVQRDIIIENCNKLITLPESQLKATTIKITNCINLQFLSRYIKVEDLELNNCTALEHLSEKLLISGNLNLTNCNKINEIPVKILEQLNNNRKTITLTGSGVNNIENIKNKWPNIIYQV